MDVDELKRRTGFGQWRLKPGCEECDHRQRPGDSAEAAVFQWAKGLGGTVTDDPGPASLPTLAVMIHSSINHFFFG